MNFFFDRHTCVMHGVPQGTKLRSFCNFLSPFITGTAIMMTINFLIVRANGQLFETSFVFPVATSTKPNKKHVALCKPTENSSR